MIRLSIAIAHAPWVPERRALVARMRAELPESVLTVDTHREGCWPTMRRAWLAARDDGSTHHLVLTDDAALCLDFLERASAAIAAHPAEAVCFFDCRLPVGRAADVGARWIRTPDACWGIATALPIARAIAWVPWVEAQARRYDSTDARLADYLRAHGLSVWSTVPALVDHGCPESSLIGHSHPALVAQTRPGPGPIDWSGPHIDAPALGFAPR